MIIEALELKNVKRFRHLNLRLKPGLNVIFGANESGKSTLALALQCAFIERVKSVPVAQALRVKTEPNKVSEISVEFQHAGAHYRIDKAFAPTKTAKLTRGDGAVRIDDAAEEALAKMWRATLSVRGATEAKHQGLLSLLMVRQADLLEPALTQSTLDVLAPELSRALLEPSAGSRDLATRIDAELALLSGARGAPVKQFAKNIEALAELTQTLQRLELPRREVAKDLDQLADLRVGQAAAGDREAQLVALRAQLDRKLDARAALAQELANLHLISAHHASARDIALADCARAKQMLDQRRARAAQRAAAEFRDKALASAQIELAQTLAQHKQLLIQLTAEKRAQTLALHAATERLEIARRTQIRRTLTALIRRTAHLEAQAEFERVALHTLRAQANTRADATAQLQKLAVLQEQSLAQATEITLTLPPGETGKQLPHVLGKALAHDQPIMLTERTDIAFGDGVKLCILPASARADGVRAAQVFATAALNAALEILAKTPEILAKTPDQARPVSEDMSAVSLARDMSAVSLARDMSAVSLARDLSSIARALAKADARQAQLAMLDAARSGELAALHRQLSLHSAGEIELVNALLAEEEKTPELSTTIPIQQSLFAPLDAAPFNAALSDPALSNPALSNPALSNPALSNPALSNPALSNPALSNPALSNPGPPLQPHADAAELLAELQRVLAAIEPRLVHAQAQFNRSQLEFEAQARSVAQTQGQLEVMQALHAQDAHTQGTNAPSDAALTQEIESAAALAQTHANALVETDHSQKTAARNVLDTAIASEKLALELAEQKAQQRLILQANLSGRIAALCRADGEILLAQTQAAHAPLAAAVAADYRRLAALTHLKTALAQAQENFERDLSLPLNEKLAPYLRCVFGASARVRFDGNLTPTHMQRGQIAALDAELADLGLGQSRSDFAVAELSVGTREQLALLVRLAYCDVLAQTGAAVLLVFDDVLAYSDDARRTAFAVALKMAAQRHQIILLSCRPNDWLGLRDNTVHQLALDARALAPESESESAPEQV